MALPNEDQSLRYQLTPAPLLASSDDWRPDYHLSPAAVLKRIGANWACLGDIGCQLIDGWRFSDRIESDWYLRNVALRDPTQRDSITGDYLEISATSVEQKRAEQYRDTIECERYYRMRHVGDMMLRVDAVLMEQPLLNDLTACVATGDVVVRRVGYVGAALVSSWHRHHPVDANIVILRGLDARQAVWVAYCLNQPLYLNYLQQSAAISSMVRVGLKQLAKMPLADRPEAFDVLAGRFWHYYERQNQSDDQLQRLRMEVSDWVAEHLPDALLSSNTSNVAARFFPAEDVGSILSFCATEQNHFARELIDKYGCVPLLRLADVNPKGSSTIDSSCKVIKISDLKGQLDVQLDTARSEENRWRYHRRQLEPTDVLVSTFVQEPKVAIASVAKNIPSFASEQLAVVSFHRTSGAYALLMETDLVRQQITRLTTGTVQRFVQPDLFKQIVIPAIETEIAHGWHLRLAEILRNKAEAQQELARLKDEMYQVYRQIHPELAQADLVEDKKEDFE